MLKQPDATPTPTPAPTPATRARNSGDTVGAARGLAAEGSASHTRSFATSRKVQKLLDITVNDNFRELVLYMNDAVPEFLENFLPPSADVSTVEEERSAVQRRSPQQQQKQQQKLAASISSSTALRSALEGRVVDLHRYFLQEWSTLNEVFEEVSDTVSKLHQESEVLQTSLDSHAARTKDFVALMTTLQAELSLVQQRDREMKEFQEKYHFGTEEQEVLNESPVDATYLDVLQSAQKTHRKCRELLLSRKHYQSAASMMDITYLAIMKGTEKVARYLISASAAVPGAVGFGADAPEMTSFCLRCVNFLREENINQWAAVVEEVARLRRAAVLRQYFHLMTTGSATTLAGTYRAGGKSSEASNTTGGTRPLEAEIGNPIFFFSSLFAWLHQVIVDEEDFMSAFFPPTPSQGVSLTTPTGTRSAEKGAVVAYAAKEGDTLAQEDVLGNAKNSELPLTKATVLDSIFEVLPRHIQSVLEGVLERFLRQASSLQDGDASGAGGGSVGGGGGGGGGGVLSTPSGPIGLTGGITRWFSAATGRVASLAPNSASGVQRYQHVLNRAQQEAIVGVTLVGLTDGLRTAHALLQLFTYCGHSTFIALLGREAALTRLIVDDAKLQLLRVYHTIAKQLMEHSLDSVGSVVSRCTVLRRLASAEATPAMEVANKSGDAATYFVTNFLFLYAAEEDVDADSVVLHDDRAKPPQLQVQQTQQLLLAGGGASSPGNRSASGNPYHRSGLSKRQAQCVDLLRVLYSMILPTPPEVEDCLRVLHATMAEAEKHVEVMEAVQGMLSKGATHVSSAPASAPACHEQFFTVLVQHVLSFPLVLARHATVSSSLDDPCKLALQLNTMSSLQEALAPYLGLLELSSEAAGHTTPLSNVVPERVQQLTTELTTMLSQCAVRHYFCRRPHDSVTQSVEGGEDLACSCSFNTVGVEEAFELDGEQLDASTVSAQLHAFYGMVAASGRVYIPIIAAVRSPRLREQIAQGVLRRLCDVYELRYKRLLKLQQQSTSADDEAAVSTSPTPFNDLEPRKLRILLEVTPP
ncbi:putative conserved oligomeric Golgi complex subunit 6-like isoform X1 [Trypanosoma rangeli]|uniref:Conserved oligomeric Golgi complex subunit 6 n=1 Tax=Trypanosoma rangeli TaxID=5698 RepID=A0A3R7NCB1_TRYRA|nr:putative conserved oligomeric Golgi complex subunit 6-like isoform X1 [Trypanosoma rangeli]RNF04214.1 putative conserved oligomeric Golgi complex subunit 6-like isoform X1 [Trypanosoma rangeli]|eukprot:RNF04214.1 putative conserved oligomeric Golgi complex subunit 6-like isoform X1 [Trypanosoma rangeli]